ncbi:MAG: hypothetical protein WDM91_09420 [Rhizomicrobium sp.]
MRDRAAEPVPAVKRDAAITRLLREAWAEMERGGGASLALLDRLLAETRLSSGLYH